MDTLLLSIKKQNIPCSLKNWSNHGIKSQVLPFTQKPKGSRLEILEKKLHRASLYLLKNKIMKNVIKLAAIVCAITLVTGCASSKETAQCCEQHQKESCE